MTDGEIVKIIRQIDRHNERINELCIRIENSDHPHGEAIVEELRANGFDTAAWAVHIVRDLLISPENWEVGCFGIRWIRSTGRATGRG